MGKIVYGVNPQYTSQECPNCKVIVKKTLSQRTHICECGCVMDRDEAGAINILAKALRELSGALSLSKCRGGQSQTSVGVNGRSPLLVNANGHINLCQLSESLADKLSG